MDTLFDAWARRNPDWEIRYEDSVVKNFCDYGRGVTNLQEARGKLFGAGYEIFIIAFFIGLYFNQRRPLNQDKSKIKRFGQAIQYWGNIDSVKGRRSYPKIRDYIFAALVARTDFDFIALDKDKKSVREAVDALMTTMEEYANWGFHFIEDKLIDNPNYFYSETAFLELFLTFDTDVRSDDEDEPESLEDEPESLEDGTKLLCDNSKEEEVIPKTIKTRFYWTSSLRQELAEKYSKGESIESLANYFKSNEKNIEDQLRKLGLF